MSKNKGRPAIYDVQSLIAAGIDPKTGLPIKMADAYDSGFKGDNKKLLRIMDEQTAINRFRWYNLPNGLDSQLIERILYYKGQGAFFYMESTDQFFFLPYALDGTIDIYGRFTSITPLPFNGTSNDGKNDSPWVQGLTKKCVYDIKLNKLNISDLNDSCVLLHDYSNQISQTNIPRQILNDPLLDYMSDILPYMKTALLNSTGIVGMRVSSEDEYSNVEAASRSIDRAALSNRKYVPIVGTVEFQEMTGGSVSKAEEFLMAMQSLDNYRLSLYGLDSGGIFEKRDQMLNAEVALNAGRASLVMQDSLTRRQHFCDVVNSIWGLGIWCDISESASGTDLNMDGMAADNQPDTVSYASQGDDNESMD